MPSDTIARNTEQYVGPAPVYDSNGDFDTSNPTFVTGSGEVKVWNSDDDVWVAATNSADQLGTASGQFRLLMTAAETDHDAVGWQLIKSGVIKAQYFAKTGAAAEPSDTPNHLVGPAHVCVATAGFVFFRVPAALEVQTGLRFTGKWYDKDGTSHDFVPHLLGWASEIAEVDSTNAPGLYSFAYTAEDHAIAIGGITLQLQANTYDEGLSATGDPFTVGFGVIEMGTAFISKLMAYAHATGLTMGGMFKRLEAWLSGERIVTTGLTPGSVHVQYLLNSVVMFEAEYDPATGARSEADTTGSDP